ncbi:MAG: hypothetical protein ACYTGH_06160 [Planctomycetota bacterium]|jgi:uncharacterized protein (TIGR03546 family)
MNPIKMVRKLGKALRGGATFSQVFIGVFLGFAIGMMPGVSLSMLILFAALLLLNVNGGVAGISLIFGKVLCLILAPLTFHIGYFMIHSLGLEGLVRSLGDTPILALLDLHVYCLIGGLPLTLLAGGALAFGLATFFEKFQAATAKAGEENKRYQKMMENKVVKALLWLAFGGKKKEEEKEKEKAPQGLILKGRLIAGAAALVLVCLISYLYLDALARRGVVAGIESMTGAEVNLDSAGLSLLSGRLTLEGLQVTDPALPTHNQVQAETLTADIDVGALLTRRFVADEITGVGVKNGAKRNAPGEVYVPVPTKEVPSELDKDASVPEKIKAYYDRVKDVQEQVKKINEYLDESDPAVEAGKTGPDGQSLTGKERLLEEARLRGYLALSAKESLSKHPGWWIKLLQIKKLEVNPTIPTMQVVAKNLSNAPSLVEEPRSIKVLPDEEAIAALKKKIGGALKDTIKEKMGSKLKGLFGR